MKRKITQIGRFFAMAALMLGAASWASAEKAPAPKIGKIYKEVKVWDLTDWNADTLLIKAENPKEEYWKRTISGGVRFSYVNTTTDELRNGNGEMLASKGGTVLPAMAGLTWVSDEGSKKPWNATLRAKMDGGDNMLQCGRQAQIGFVQEEGYPKVGQIIVLNISALGTGNAGRGIDLSKSKGVKPLFSTEQKDSLWCGTSTEPNRSLVFEVTDASALKFYTIKGIGIRKISILEKQAEPVDTLHVAYVGDAVKTYEPAYRALDNASKVEGNKVKIDYIDMATYTNDNLPKAEAFSGYDVLVLGGTGNGTGSVLKTFADSVIGTLPVVTTRAFWYSSDRFAWSSQKGSNANGTDVANYVLPETPYKHHPIFEGLVDAENFDADSIFVFEKKKTLNEKRYMQGYPDAAMNADAPVHTTLATSADKGDQSAGRLKSVAEFWRTSNPYVLVGIDIDLRDKSKTGCEDPIYPNEDGDQLLVNAVNYAANALAPFQPSNLGTCDNPEITFEKVNKDGKTDSDTMRYVVKITVDKVKDANNSSQEIYPTVMITIGSGAAKKYDFDHPDTIWESCTVKAKATALLYEDSKEVSAEFTANLRELKAPEFEAVEVEGKGYKVSFKTYETTIDNEVTQPTIRYSLDGGAEVVYDPAKDSIISTLTAIVRAWASLMYHEKSEVSETVWNKPGETATTAPTISATNVAGLFTITITGEEGSKIYYTLDGTDPRTSSTKEEYNNAIDCEVFENPVTVKACALADGKVYSSVEEKTLTNENPITLSTPTFTIEGGSFTIASTTEGAPAGSYTIYYTTNGSEPDELNGLIYTDKVTFKGGDKFKVKAIAIGKGYKTSAVGESEEVTPTGEVDVCGKLNYYSTFNRDDPSVRYDDKQNPENQTWGWFRWVPGTDTKWDKTPNNHTSRTNGNTYITDEEWNDGVYYDGEGSPRPLIFYNDDKGGWRHFNDWVFWKDGRTFHKSSDGKKTLYRRILVQNGMAPKEDKEGAQALPGFSGGALYIFNHAEKADAGPDSLFQGPFAVVINISGADKLAGAAADVNVCVANDAMGANEMVLSKVSCEAKAGKSDTVYYYGDQKVYVRLTTESESVLVFDFQVFKPGVALPTLTHTGITPEAGLSFAMCKPVKSGTKEITVTFNNEINVDTEAKPYLLPLNESGEYDEKADNAGKGIEGKVSLGSDKKSVVITLDRAIDAKDGQMYYSIVLPEATAADADNGVDYRNKHTNDKITMYYEVDGVSAIDEVSAAKEVVATYIYSISGAQMTTLAPGVNIVKKVYSDGTTTTEKVQAK